MRKLRKISLAAFAVAVLAPISASALDVLNFGAGVRQGVYSSLGRAICLVINNKPLNLECRVTETQGSIDNLLGLKKGVLDMGVVQSDIQFQAVTGTGAFEAVGPLSGMRALFSAHGEQLAVVASIDSKIRVWDQLPGNRINIGPVTSGTNATMRLLLGAQGWSTATFKEIGTMAASEQAEAFCAGKIDAATFLAGHPNRVVIDLIRNCGGNLVQVTGSVIERVIAENRAYVRAVIPPDPAYKTTQDTPTIGLYATVMTAERVDPDKIYRVIREVFENLDFIRAQRPNFKTLDPTMMAFRGLTAPYHPGAARYLRETGRLARSGMGVSP